MVNDSIEELLDLDMEHKPETQRWTSTYQAEAQPPGFAKYSATSESNPNWWS